MAKIYGSQKLIPASVSFVDIAGLVKGAASGEGLGNKFLSHIREVDLILHVIRCFENNDPVDPLDHFDTIISELILKDLESIEKRQVKISSLMKAAQNKPAEKKALETEQALLTNLHTLLSNTKVEEARTALLESKVETVPLIATKKFLVVANLSENDFILAAKIDQLVNV